MEITLKGTGIESLILAIVAVQDFDRGADSGLRTVLHFASPVRWALIENAVRGWQTERTNRSAVFTATNGQVFDIAEMSDWDAIEALKATTLITAEGG